MSTTPQPGSYDSEPLRHIDLLIERVVDETRAETVVLKAATQLPVEEPAEWRSMAAIRVSHGRMREEGTANLRRDTRTEIVPLEAFMLGVIGELIITGPANRAEISPGTRSGLTAWCVEAYCRDENLALEVLHRLGRATPVLHRMRTSLIADAAILWRLDRTDKTPIWRAQTSSGFQVKSVDIVPGQGVIGKLTVDSAPTITELVSEQITAHPELVRRHGWKWCYSAPLVDESTHIGIVAFYFTSVEHPVISDGFLHPRLAPHRYILTADVARRVAIEERLRENRRLAETVSKLQVGLAVLGLAHDLKKRAESLHVVATAISEALPKSEGGREQLIRMLSRLEISIAQPDAFRSAIESSAQDSEYIANIVSAMNRVSEAKSAVVRKLNVASEVEAIEPMLTALAGRSRKLTFEFDRHLSVRASETDIARTLLNTVSNSVAWGAKTITVSVAAVRARRHGAKQIPGPDLTGHRASDVVIAIIDDGQGMSRSLLSVCREPFESRRPGGTGLGLFVVSHIANSLRGSLYIESTEGVGTAVFLVLPAA